MARQKLSEFRSKTLVSEALGIPYIGWSVLLSDRVDALSAIHGYAKFVLKVDQGIKGRYKKGLVLLNIPEYELSTKLDDLAKSGYESFIIEPQVPHADDQERYLALSRYRDQIKLSYSRMGGVDIESNTSAIESFAVDEKADWAMLAERTGFSRLQIESLLTLFTRHHMTLLEINPYIVEDGEINLLDCAIEVDDAAAYFTNAWSEDDFRRSTTTKVSDEETIIRRLDEKSPASLKLEMINADGSIFLLLSGGGASVVVADEIYNHGLGKQLANYGEYSGNPSKEETYIYTLSVLRLLLKSQAEKKILFVGGAVANFTDITSTFAGIIKAIDELSAELMKQSVKIFVRRGGPRQELGLEQMRIALDKYNLLGAVHSPTTSLSDAVEEAIKEIK